MMKKILKNGVLRDSQVDQSMLFPHLYVMQGEKIDAWFVSEVRRQYFGVESTAYLSVNNLTKKSTHWWWW